MSAWYIMNNNYPNLPASDELHSEEYSGNEYKIDQPIDEDVVKVSNDNEKQFVDDPRKGARTLESNWIYSGSSILLKKRSIGMDMKLTTQT